MVRSMRKRPPSTVPAGSSSAMPLPTGAVYRASAVEALRGGVGRPKSAVTSRVFPGPIQVLRRVRLAPEERPDVPPRRRVRLGGELDPVLVHGHRERGPGGVRRVADRVARGEQQRADGRPSGHSDQTTSNGYPPSPY